MPNYSKLINELRSSLGNEDEIRENGFSILSRVSALSGSKEYEQEFQELVLRALEKRAFFHNYKDLLNALVRHIGLYPYLDQESLSLRDQVAYEYHKPINFEEEIVFHSAQGEIYRRLIGGENIALSAPTSYGKSLIIDAIIATGVFNNIVIVVPTIALIDETRKRLSGRFSGIYKIITHATQSPANRNIYILTQERVLEMDSLEHIEFFVIDEFYKLSPDRGDSERSNLLNQAFYRLYKYAKRFYMLGPSIDGLSQQFQERVDCFFIFDPYQTVVTELIDVYPGEDEFSKLIEIIRELDDSTSIFCRSPKRASDIAKLLIEADIGEENNELKAAAEWVASNYHPDWHFVQALRRGIGIHHGRIPRSLAQYTVQKYNEGIIRYMVCTSTLIEGVNTKAKYMIIFDNEINRIPIDYFTFNNIRGRSGRMMQHFIGKVFMFHNQPESQLPLIDVPAYTQDKNASDSLLIQLDYDDLLPEAKERIKKYSDQDLLKYQTLKDNTGIDPDAQLELAAEIYDKPYYYNENLNWSGFPNYDELIFMCKLIWEYFDGFRLARGSIRSYKQLNLLINRLKDSPSTKDLITAQLEWEIEPDEAVQQILDFQRLWAMFHFPRLLNAVDNIQNDVFSRLKLPIGNYSTFSGLVENLFLDPAIIALDEYGIPLEMARKFQDSIASNGNLDETLRKLKSINTDYLGLSDFEKSIVDDAISYL